MTKLVFSLDEPEPNKTDKSLYAKFYKKHDFKNILESYLAWGPESIEVHAHTTPAGRKMIVDSMYYLHVKGKMVNKKERAPRDHLETLCKVFCLAIKPLKK